MQAPSWEKEQIKQGKKTRKQELCIVVTRTRWHSLISQHFYGLFVLGLAYFDEAVVSAVRPIQSIIYDPLQLNRFQKSVLLIIQYNFLKSCSGDFILQNLILRTRSCGTDFITQSSWVFHFHPTILVDDWKCFVPHLYQLRRGISEGPALKYFYMIQRGGWFVAREAGHSEVASDNNSSVMSSTPYAHALLVDDDDCFYYFQK